MNATSALELWAYNIFEPFFQIKESPDYYTITEEILGLAKANVTEHVITLLSTQNNESIAESINFLSEMIIEYSPSVATAVEHCTLAAFINLTQIENVTSMNPLEYVPSIKNATKNCLIEKGAVSEVQKEFEVQTGFEDEDENPWAVFVKLFWFSWAPVTVLFGPMWEILFPCRNQPYPCKGR
ncbi:hypothetical protein FJTKL_07113 [Diaporthe vaccinii]|uniref:Uncharacterized protein n=1 Tax=Diaporthe vaccinii TaxID=105482 RepID=A0ABR4EV67_9PEZI